MSATLFLPCKCAKLLGSTCQPCRQPSVSGFSNAKKFYPFCSCTDWQHTCYPFWPISCTIRIQKLSQLLIWSPSSQLQNNFLKLVNINKLWWILYKICRYLRNHHNPGSLKQMINVTFDPTTRRKCPVNFFPSSKRLLCYFCFRQLTTECPTDWQWTQYSGNFSYSMSTKSCGHFVQLINLTEDVSIIDIDKDSSILAKFPIKSGLINIQRRTNTFRNII